MKLPFKTNRKQAYVLAMMLVMVGAFSLFYASTVNRTNTVAKLNERNNSWLESLNAAEAATEKVIARMRYDYVTGQDASVTNNISMYRTNVPKASDHPYWGNFVFSDGTGTTGRTYVQAITSRTYTNLTSQYAGLKGFQTVYRVLSNVRPLTGAYPVSAAVMQDVETDSIPVFQFAIFYNGLLEFSTCATMTVRGRVHANGSIYTGSSSQLTFYDTVTTAGTISSPANAGGGPSWTYKGTYNGSPTYRTNVPTLTLPVGTNNSAAAVHAIIEMPPAGESVTSDLGVQRYYNKAGVVLLVSNSTATVILKNSPSDASPTTISVNTYGTNSLALRTNFNWLSITNLMRDNRENKTVKLTQIDMALLREWARTNTSVTSKFPSGSGVYPNIMYIADNRSVASATNNAVRLVNGQTILTNGGTGFTLSTANPLYVKGHYNAPSTATTNTSQTQPASLVSDALTILSANWSDANSFSSYSTSSSAYDAVDGTTVNAAVITGVKPSVGTSSSTYSGGVHNLPRLLEDWGSRKLWLNTSIVCLFNSTIATNQFQMPNTYYTAPTREFSFDFNFQNVSKLPPGTPMLSVILRSTWRNPPLNTTNYAGL